MKAEFGTNLPAFTVIRKKENMNEYIAISIA